MAAGAVAMLVLSLSGMMLVARRAGGWRHWCAPMRGPLAGRLHVKIARIAVLGLVLSSITALWMTASTFGLLADLALLDDTPVAELRALNFPYPGDATDVFTLKTDRGTGYLDQGTGALVSWADLTGWARVSETVYTLHTGQGAATLGLVLGVTEDLNDIGDVMDLKVLLHRLADILGVDHMTLHCCSAKAANSFAVRVVTTYPKTWVDFYLRRSFPLSIRFLRGQRHRLSDSTGSA